jgi:hypothetical protein
MRNGDRILIGKGKKPLGDSCIKEDNIRMDLKETGCENVNQNLLAQERLMAGCCEH